MRGETQKKLVYLAREVWEEHSILVKSRFPNRQIFVGMNRSSKISLSLCWPRKDRETELGEKQRARKNRLHRWEFLPVKY